MEEALSVLVSGQTEGERKGWFLPEWKHFPCPEQLTGQRTVSHASPLNPSEHRQALSRLHTPFPPHSSMAGSPAPTRLDASEVSTLFAQMGALQSFPFHSPATHVQVPLAQVPWSTPGDTALLQLLAQAFSAQSNNKG